MESSQQMSNDLIKKAAKVNDLLNQSDESQESLYRLKAEYARATRQAAYLRDAENKSRETIKNLRNELEQFKTNFEEKAVGGTTEEQIEELKKDIAKLRKDIESSNEEFKELKIKFRSKNRKYEAISELNKKYKEELEQNSNTLEQWEQSIQEMRVNNRQTKKDLQKEDDETEQLKVTLSDTTEIDKQKEKNNQLQTVLDKLNMEISMLHSQYDKILLKISLKEKELRSALKNNDRSAVIYEEKIAKLNTQEEKYNQLKASLSEVEQDGKKEIPEYKEMLKKYREVTKQKNELRNQSNGLQVKLYELSLKQTKSDGEKYNEVRKVSAAKLDLTQVQHKKKEEECKTLEVIGQKQSLIHEQVVSKQHTFNMKKKMDSINTEIEGHLNQRKLANANYMTTAEIVEKTKLENDRGIEELGSIRKQTEAQSSQIEKVKEERNSLKKQYEMATQDHQQLEAQYKELVDSIASMTERVEEISKETAHDHFFANEMKAAIQSLLEMRTKCTNGINTTSKVINNLQCEEQTLKRIIDQTILDHNGNLKELQSLKESKTDLQNQIAEKTREIAELEDEIKNSKALMDKRARDFDGVMDTIQSLNDELEIENQRTRDLEDKVKYCNELKITYKTLNEHMMIANVRTTALYQESAITRGFHRWLEIEAYDHEQMMNIKLVDHLNDKLNKAHAEHRKLLDKRDELKKQAESMKITQTNALPNDETEKCIKALKEDLKQKDKMIKTIKDRIIQTNTDITEAQSGMKVIKKNISDRKEVTFDLMATIAQQTARSARSQRSLRSQESQEQLLLSQNTNGSQSARDFQRTTQSANYNEADPMAYFITEPPITAGEHTYDISAAKALGGGFKPHPPRAPRGAPDVPKIRIEDVESLKNPPPPNSQRYQRPNLGSLRKKLTKPIQTPRFDHSRKSARVPAIV